MKNLKKNFMYNKMVGQMFFFFHLLDGILNRYAIIVCVRVRRVLMK